MLHPWRFVHPLQGLGPSLTKQLCLAIGLSVCLDQDWVGRHAQLCTKRFHSPAQGPGGEYIEYVPDDFSGFRVIALVPRMRPQWPAPGMQEVSNTPSICSQACKRLHLSWPASCLSHLKLGAPGALASSTHCANNPAAAVFSKPISHAMVQGCCGPYALCQQHHS